MVGNRFLTGAALNMRATVRRFAVPCGWKRDARASLRELSTTTTALFPTASGDDGVRVGAPILPLRPIWPGFVIDALFYAAIWFGIFFGFASARRALRRRRGRCPKCNYDLRGQMAEVRGQMSEISKGCPECGWNRPRESG